MKRPVVKGSPKVDQQYEKYTLLTQKLTTDRLKNVSRKGLRDLFRATGHLCIDALFHCLIKGEQSTGGQTGAARVKKKNAIKQNGVSKSTI